MSSINSDKNITLMVSSSNFEDDKESPQKN